jgi:RND superfamily putative drug exporter
VLVTGRSANLVDTKAALFTRLPFALAFIAVVTFALLFMTFGSVVIPAKALVLNLLSLSATFGALVWIFQDGHLGNLLGITATGGLDPVIPILMFCIAYKTDPPAAAPAGSPRVASEPGPEEESGRTSATLNR